MAFIERTLEIRDESPWHVPTPALAVTFCLADARPAPFKAPGATWFFAARLAPTRALHP